MSAERAKQASVAILFLETRARSCLQPARWRLLRHQRATEAQVKKPPHTPAARSASPHRSTSTQRCATPLMPSAFTCQPRRVTSLSPLLLRDRLPCALAPPLLLRSFLHFPARFSRKPTPMLSVAPTAKHTARAAHLLPPRTRTLRVLARAWSL